ncbi:MAG: hypothetical protein ABR530_08015 [Pyrinomonadaceae bacterium]
MPKKKNRVTAGLLSVLRPGIYIVLILILVMPSSPVRTQERERVEQIDNRVKLINNLEKYGIKLIGPADPSFEDEMNRYLGRNFSKLKPLIETAGPLGVLVKSESPKPVLGISLRWEFVSDYGRTHIYPQGISSPGELMGMVALDPNLQGKTSLLYGSNMRFFSPLQGVESVIVYSGQNVVFPASNYSIDSHGIARTASQAQYEKSMFKNTGTCRSVAVDGILFNDGTFVGESQTGFFESINGSIDATREFLKNLRLAATRPGGLSRAIVEPAEKDLADSREAPSLMLEDKYRLSYITATKNIQEQIRRQRAAGFSDIDIAQKEFLDRYLKFTALKRL